MGGEGAPPRIEAGPALLGRPLPRPEVWNALPELGLRPLLQLFYSPFACCVGGAGGQNGQDGQSVLGANCQANTFQCTTVTYQGGAGGTAGETLTLVDGNGVGGSVANPGGFFNPPVTAYSIGGAGGGGYTGGSAGTSGGSGPSNAGGFFTEDVAGAGGGGGGSSFVGGEETVGSPAASGAPAEVIITYTPGPLGTDPPTETPEAPAVLMLPTAGVFLLGGWLFTTRRRRRNEAPLSDIDATP
jgi:hypothetical protein